MKIDEEITQEIMRLTDAQQSDVLAFAKALRQKDESEARELTETSIPEKGDPHGTSVG